MINMSVAMPTMKRVLASIGVKIHDVVEGEEKKHGPGVLFLEVKEGKISCFHLAMEKFEGDDQMQGHLSKVKDDEFAVIFRNHKNEQEFGIVGRRKKLSPKSKDEEKSISKKKPTPKPTSQSKPTPQPQPQTRPTPQPTPQPQTKPTPQPTPQSKPRHRLGRNETRRASSTPTGVGVRYRPSRGNQRSGRI